MNSISNWRLLRVVLIGFAALTAAACGDARHGMEEAGHDAAADYERGPHRGRMLREGDLAMEVTIYETGQEPQFRVYPYRQGEPLAPREVSLTIELTRLDGEVNRFAFTPEGDYLAGDGVVVEPHSFDVAVMASYDNQSARWTYESYEGRTTIDPQVAEDAGVMVEEAGPATLVETITLSGRIDFAPGAKAQVRGRYPGRVLKVSKSVGDAVKAGDVLATIESNTSLANYTVVAPIDGVVLERATNVGDVVGDAALFLIGDTSRLVADLHVFPNDVSQVRPGTRVKLKGIDGADTIEAEIGSFLPVAETATQTRIARVPLAGIKGPWAPGMYVEGVADVAEYSVPLAVRVSGIQRFRDFEVVYAKVGDTYEVRMLEIGRRTDEWAEVLGGIKPGQAYVSANSFLIKADIEKSGASHDH